MFPLADTHCHLDFRQFDDDRDAVIARCRDSGIRWILNPGVDLDSSERAVRLAEEHPEIYAAVGIHPNDGGSWDTQSLARLRTLAEHPKVVAIGEIGLDFYRDTTDHDTQLRIFKDQLGLAAEMGLPVIIHSRNAARQVLEILREWWEGLGGFGSALVDQPGVLHSFEGDLEIALQAVEMNFVLGVGGPVTFRNAPEKRALISALTLDAFVLETDAPFLAPHPHRGERNEPAYVRWVAETVAAQANSSVSSVAQTTSKNAARLFAWRETA